MAAEQLDVDPFITTALHLNALTSHSRVDGQFTITGALLRPESLTVAAELSHFAVEYESIKLENQGPLKFHYGGHEIRVEQADLRGTDTDFHITGFARFAGDRAVDLRLNGAVNLGLIGALRAGAGYHAARRKSTLGLPARFRIPASRAGCTWRMPPPVLAIFPLG